MVVVEPGMAAEQREEEREEKNYLWPTFPVSQFSGLAHFLSFNDSLLLPSFYFFLGESHI